VVQRMTGWRLRSAQMGDLDCYAPEWLELLGPDIAQTGKLVCLLRILVCSLVFRTTE
jgi:hypothetical protein